MPDWVILKDAMIRDYSEFCRPALRVVLALALFVLSMVAAWAASISVAPDNVIGGTPSSVTVTLDAPAPPLGVVVSLSSNSPAAKVPATVTVPGGQASVTVAVATARVDTQVQVSIAASISGASVTALLTVNPISLASFSISAPSIVGGVGLTGTVSLSASAGVGGVPVSLASNAAAATVPATVTIPAGQTSATFPVGTKRVSVKTDVTFTASLGLVSSTAPLSVFPEGPASVSLNPPALNGGQPSVGTITLTGPAPAGGMVVTLSCNNKDATIPPSVKVEAATTTATFNIKTVKIAVPVAATITARYGTQIQTAVLSIAPPGISSMVLNPASVTGTAPAGVTLILAEPAPAGGLRIVLSCDQPAATVPAQIVIPSGKTTASFTVRTVGVPAQLVVNVKAMIGNVPKLAPLTILPPSLLSLILETPVVDGGNGSGGVVTISSPAPPVGLIVTLASNQKGAAPPVNVTIPAGRTSASFSIKTTKVTAQTMATITATFGGTSQTATLTIN